MRDVKKFVKTKIRHDVKKFVMMLRIDHDVHKFRYDVKNMSWRQKGCHEVTNMSGHQKCVMTSKMTWQIDKRCNVTKSHRGQTYIDTDSLNTIVSQPLCYSTELLSKLDDCDILNTSIYHQAIIPWMPDKCVLEFPFRAIKQNNCFSRQRLFIWISKGHFCIHRWFVYPFQMIKLRSPSGHMGEIKSG